MVSAFGLGDFWVNGNTSTSTWDSELAMTNGWRLVNWRNHEADCVHGRIAEDLHLHRGHLGSISFLAEWTIGVISMDGSAPHRQLHQKPHDDD